MTPLTGIERDEFLRNQAQKFADETLSQIVALRRTCGGMSPPDSFLFNWSVRNAAWKHAERLQLAGVAESMGLSTEDKADVLYQLAQAMNVMEFHCESISANATARARECGVEPLTIAQIVAWMASGTLNKVMSILEPVAPTRRRAIPKA